MNHIPDTLWHYTDADGLFGIVSSSRLRFGDARFLNDRTERAYGQQLLERIFDEEVSADKSGAAAAFRNMVRHLRQPDRLYICALSATKESISQWERYGAGGTGYCVGFSRQGLDDLLHDEPVSCKAMLYDEAAQEELLRAAVTSGLGLYRKLEAVKDPPKYFPLAYLSTDVDISWAALQMKSPFFHDEQEWRYFFSTDDADDDSDPDDRRDRSENDENEPLFYAGAHEHFAVRGPYVKPFVELPRPRKDIADRLPIVGIICGPKLDGEVAVPTTRRFLRSHGYRVPVERSRLAEIWR